MTASRAAAASSAPKASLARLWCQVIVVFAGPAQLDLVVRAVDLDVHVDGGRLRERFEQGGDGRDRGLVGGEPPVVRRRLKGEPPAGAGDRELVPWLGPLRPRPTPGPRRAGGTGSPASWRPGRSRAGCRCGPLAAGRPRRRRRPGRTPAGSARPGPSAGRNTLRCDVGAASANPSRSSPVTSTDTSRGAIFDTETTSARRGGLRRRGPAGVAADAGVVTRRPLVGVIGPGRSALAGPRAV